MTKSVSLKTYSMPLNQLLSVISVDTEESLLISNLELDSRKVTDGTLFIAYPGGTVDGRNFIEDAQTAGAVAVLYEAGDAELPAQLTIPAFAVTNLQTKVGVLAHQFYGKPSEEMQIFGITGTNGKTTCCYLLTQALTKLKMNAVMIGTIGIGHLDDLNTTTHTTPDPISIHHLLAQWRDQGITQVCMEVSSHALDQGRVNGVQFFCTLFTNLSHDHLDYHADMASYQFAKQALFTDFASELVITNADDLMGASLIDVANSGFISSYGINNGDVRCEDIELKHNGMSFTIESNQIEFDVSTTLIGEINIPNILMLVTTLLSLSVSVEDIQIIVADLRAAPGRMELYSAHEHPSVVVDYAHTPDALEKALQSIAKHCAGELWCVFGCGGDRDKLKRPVMGEVAARLADKVILTNDNPRTENAVDIAAEISAGVTNTASDNFLITLDRSQAIADAVALASANDWILIAGKGHEATQLIDGEYLPFSDREEVVRCLGLAA